MSPCVVCSTLCGAWRGAYALCRVIDNYYTMQLNMYA